jgi:NAD(P)-dependent dehydrogenase (short-subunit alcohol dehydrogenase family)
MAGRVQSKIALVTGAGMGLGRAASLLLASEGASVVVTDIDEPAGQATARVIADTGVSSLFIRQDVSLEADWPPVMQAIEQRFGRLDIMINNAGIAVGKNVEETTFEDWRRTMAVNLDGVFLGCKHAIALMKRTGGSIVNLSSIDGIIGEAHLAAYCASKGGVRTLTKAVAVHCAEAGYGIRCNSIHPGYIWTPQTENYLRSLGKIEEEKVKATRRHPIGFLGEPSDVAYLVLYLASDESRFVTGAEMVVDGGYLAV